ncbi:MAG TPA: hypothetical protein VJI69_06055, partial [Bacteroidia bacterium]|nr:hypothetical protein [Bacteroidia bacterium]
GLGVTILNNSQINMISAASNNISIGEITIAVEPGDRIGQSQYGDFILEKNRHDDPNDLYIMQLSSNFTDSAGYAELQSVGSIVLS